ncbi:MAG: hypothetical protein ACUVQ5_02440 [Candidatus Methanomethylicaceae archaeon]
MKEFADKISLSIKRALTLMEDLSNSLSEESCNISTYKKILLCRMEIQYSIALLRLTSRSHFTPAKISSPSTLDVSRIVQLLTSSLEVESPEETLDSLYQVDSSLAELTRLIRRKIRSDRNTPRLPG